MAGESKKISFGFKVSKKNIVIQSKRDIETQNDIQYIDCLEEKSIKLVNGEEEKKKELPIIPMLNGNLLRESIREVAKTRAQNKNDVESTSDVISKEDNKDAQKEPLTLDQLATKEILDDLKKSEDKKTENVSAVVPANIQTLLEKKEPSSLEDYENMPISDFGLAMLRGMGWDPNKGIGLNEKIVTPLAPTLRPKGMGLGADKVPSSKNVSSNGELLIMKKGAPVKIISGLHNNQCGKIEGFDELPGRLMVRLSQNNVVVSLNEIMVELISLGEYNKNVDQLKNVIAKTEAESERYKREDNKLERTEKSSVPLKDEDKYGLIYSKDVRDSKEKEKQIENPKILLEKKSKKKERYEKSVHSYSDEMESHKYFKSKRSKETKSHRSTSSYESTSSYKHSRATAEENWYKSRNQGSHYKNYKRSNHYYDSRQSFDRRRSKNEEKLSRSSRRKHENTSSSDSDAVKRTRKSKRSSSSDGASSSDSCKKVSHSRKYKKQYYKR